MKHKAFIVVMLFSFISFSYLPILSVAFRTTGTPLKNSNKEIGMVFKEHLTNTKQVELEEIEIKEGFFEKRMDLETTDYSGVGANPEHDPRPPGKD